MEKQLELCSPVACLRASRALPAATSAAACASGKAASKKKHVKIFHENPADHSRQTLTDCNQPQAGERTEKYKISKFKK
jgi:hypothetical protein